MEVSGMMNTVVVSIQEFLIFCLSQNFKRAFLLYQLKWRQPVESSAPTVEWLIWTVLGSSSCVLRESDEIQETAQSSLSRHIQEPAIGKATCERMGPNSRIPQSQHVYSMHEKHHAPWGAKGSRKFCRLEGLPQQGYLRILSPSSQSSRPEQYARRF